MRTLPVASRAGAWGWQAQRGHGERYGDGRAG